MAVLDAYSPCPCGSGQKYKWCCQKVEAYAERSIRLFDSGQTESAIDALDEGLRKEPGNSWLLNRKALLQIRLEDPAGAKATLQQVLQKDPKHLGALILMTRLTLESQGSAAGAAQLQEALIAFPYERRRDLANLVKVVGAFLSESGDFPAALRHLRLAQNLIGDEPDTAIVNTIRMIEGNASIPPWLKNSDELAPAPEGLKGEPLSLFNEAIKASETGSWSEAASLFSMLSSDPIAGPLATRNHGFNRLWLADDTAAATSFRHYAAGLGPTTEAVDLEALCQEIVPPAASELVEHAQLSWPIRNRDVLLEGLRSDPTIADLGVGPYDEDEEGSPEGEHFSLLNAKKLGVYAPGLKAEQIPIVEGHVFVGSDHVHLQCFDDGRLDNLSDRFLASAGRGVPPAHPKTKIIAKLPTLQVALMWEWLLPEETPREESRRLNAEYGRQLIRSAWPNVKMNALHGRTPRQAAKDGDSVVALRAAVCQLEQSRERWQRDFDFQEFRQSLGIELEPTPDPQTIEVAKLHLARLGQVPIEGLSDLNLVSLYRRSRANVITDALERSAIALTERPEVMIAFNIEPLSLYSDLAMIAAARFERDVALNLLKAGRDSENPAKKARNAAVWDMLEVRVGAQLDPPTVWVAELAIVLERYREDEIASQALTLSLLDMNLIQVVPNPDRPGAVMIDSRMLQTLLAQYGPRVTTASGKLGISATKPEIWTPGSTSSSSPKSLWTPGAASNVAGPGSTTSEPSAPGGSKLILPGR